ncbi:DUF916 domain-containing protein [Microbispora triticiradicis]|nr:DUF916 domain-containing protein [Microbispora triticiradicis]
MYSPGPRTTTAADTLARAALARAVVVALLAAIGLLAAGAKPAAAADGEVSWTVRTASNDFGSDRRNYAYTLDPGGRIEDGLVVVNHGTTPLHLAVYAADAFTTGQGGLDLAGEDATPAGVGAWVHPGRPDVTVPPGESAEVPFTVALPDDAAPGEYMGGVVTGPPRSGEADGRRRGIRIRLRVGGELRPSLSVEGLHVGYSGTPDPFGKGDATVTYTIRNTGNAILTARQEVSTSGPFGRFGVRAGRIADSPPLLPGEAWKVSVPVRGVAPALRLTGTVTLVPLLADASGSVAPLAAVESATDAWAVPWAALLVLVVLGGLVVTALAVPAAGRRVTRRAADIARRARTPSPKRS